MTQNFVVKRVILNGDNPTGPELWGAISVQALPRVGDQIIEGPQAERAFTVELVEWWLEKGEVHLFCIEHPKEEPYNLELLS